MKKYLLLALVIVASSCMQHSRQLFNYAKDKPIIIDSVNVSEYLEKYKDYDAVYLKNEITVEHFIPSGLMAIWVYSVIQSHTYIIIDPESDNYAVFKRGNYPKKALKNAYLRVYFPDGRIEEYSKKDFKINITDNRETWSMAYPGLVKGCIIEEKVQMQYSMVSQQPPLEEQYGLELNVPTDKLSLTFAYPSWWEAKIKDTGPAIDVKFDVTVKEEPKKTIVTYTATNVPAYEYEPFSPYRKEISKYIQWFITDLEAGNMFKRGMKSWDEVARQVRPYAVDNDAFFSSRVKDTTYDLVKDKKDKHAILDTIVTYVQKNIEIKQSRKISDFADVLKYRMGNPYLITGLTKLMLFKAGIESDYLMIHPSSEGYFDDSIYEFSQIRNPALKVNLGDEEYLVFPYINYLDYRAIPPLFIDQPALIVPKDYKTKARLIRTPKSSLIENGIISNMEVNIDEDGTVNIMEKRSLTGLPAFGLRSELADMDEEETDKYIEELLGYNQGEIEVQKIETEQANEIKPPLIISISYTLNNLVTITPEEVIFQTAGLFSPLNINKRKFNPEKREHPIKIDYAMTSLKDININFPENWSLQSEFKTIDVSNKYGNASIKFTTDQNHLNVKINRDLNISEGPKEEISDLMHIYSSQSRLAIPDIIFDIN